MSALVWLIILGVLLLSTSFLSGWIRRGPVTTFAIYLVAGVLLGPGVLNLAALDFSAERIHLLRAISEAALVVSLFITGLKLRIGFRNGGWLMSLRLAIPAMALTAGGVVLVAMHGLGWPLPWALALAAMVCPTDPVLASLVSVDDARDDDALRVALSGEAGMNDATALPLLFLALALAPPDAQAPGNVLAHWALVDVLWGFGGGLAIGLAAGWGFGFIGTRLRHATRDVAPSDFLALGIMVLAYGASELVHASGFLAAFAAGVGLRRVELGVANRVKEKPDEDVFAIEPAEMRVNPNERARASVDHAGHTVGWVVSDALSFGETMERIIAALLVLVVGIVAVPALGWTSLALAGLLMVVIRPLAVWICTIGSPVPWQRRLLIGWFGIRGLGSLNYLAYGLAHGLGGTQRAGELVSLVITVVATSVLIHGMTVTPLMQWRERAIQRLRHAREEKA